MATNTDGQQQQQQQPQTPQTPPKTLPTSSTPGASSPAVPPPHVDASGGNNNNNNHGSDSGAGAADKPRLTEQEKKSNHIASEQKRRQAIREGFDEMADLVPGLAGQGRSEAVVLDGAVEFIKRLLAERWRMLMHARERGLDASAYEMDEQSMGIARAAAEAGY